MKGMSHVANIKAPVFIIHGKKDIRVNYKHATLLKDKLDELGKPYEWMMKSNEGHGFRKIEMFEIIEKFLAKHL